MSANKLSSQTTDARARATASNIMLAGAVSMAAAVAANLVVRAFLFVLLDLPGDFPPLMALSVIIFTLIGTGLGVLAYALVNKYSKNPTRTYLLIAAVALILSILPNFGLMANPAAAPFPGGSALAFGVLIIFHITAALVFIPLLLKLSRTTG
jgi:F0F1-type ATP synthase assembly protein I